MDEKIDSYIKWNQAFVQYFFEDSTEENEVILFVNDEVIDTIGEANGLGDHAEFLRSMSLLQHERAAFYNSMRRTYVGCQPYGKTSKSLFEFGTFFTDHGFKTSFPCIYLNFIILAIYLASIAQTNHETDLGKSISDWLKEHLNDNGKRDGLETLFKALHRDYPSFRNYKLNKQRYVGLIKYQLVLSKSQIEHLEGAMYHNGFRFTDDKPYEEIIYTFRDYVGEDLKDVLVQSLSSDVYRKRIEDILFNFDPEEYAISHDHPGSRKMVGVFVHALCFSEGEGRLVLLTDVKDLNIQEKEYRIVEEAFDSLSGYNPHHVLVKGVDKVYIEDRKLITDQCNIKSIQQEGVLFFKKYSDTYYIETRQASQQETFVAVHNDKEALKKWEKYRKSQSNPIITLKPSLELESVFGKDWYVYFAPDGFVTPFYKDKITIDRKTVSINTGHITVKSGIKPKNKVNVYLANALPYYEFPCEIDEELLSVYINIEDEPLVQNEDFKIYIKGNCLIIDLIGTDFCQGHSLTLDITVEYRTPKLAITNSYSICGQDILYDEEQLYRYDKWGAYIQDEMPVTYVSGNQLYGVPACSAASRIVNVKFRTAELGDFSRFYFINLLSAICFMNTNRSITNKVLKKCIRYAGTRKHVDYQQDGKLFTTLRNLAVNLGYLCPCYENGMTKYQAMPPTFIKIPARVDEESLTAQHSHMYMLSGCYTRKFLNDLNDYCQENGIVILEKDQQKSRQDSAYALFPPILLFDDDFDPEDFKKVTGNACGRTSNDFALELISFLPLLPEYEQTLQPIPQGAFNADIEPSDEDMFPRVRRSVIGGYRSQRWLETVDNQFFKSTVSDFAWMDLYCRFKQQKPSILYGSTGEVCIPVGLHLPSLLQRAMCIMNLGQPEFAKLFITDNRLTPEPLYSKFKVYKIGTGNNRLNSILRLITNAVSANDSQMLCKSFSVISFEMYLWTKTIRFDNQPSCFLFLKEVGTSGCLAVATEHTAYVNRNGSLVAVKGKPNAVLSRLLHSYGRNKTDDTDFVFEKDVFNIPSEENYKIEPVLIR